MENTKTCSKCGLTKSVDDFSFVYPARNDGKRRPDCKTCVSERTRVFVASQPQAQRERMKKFRRDRRLTTKAFVSQYLKDHPCVDCGESDIDVLDFDHVKGNKVAGISYLVGRTKKISVLLEEIEKCEVRCANCHRRATRKRERESF